MTLPILETKRLKARPFQLDDLPELLMLHSDPEVNRYLHPSVEDWDTQAARQTLGLFLETQEKLGFSQWRLSTHEDEFVGRAGFSIFKETAEVEMSYVLKRDFWRQGLGREIVGEMVHWFFDNTYYSHLLAFVDPENHAGKQIMKDVGFYFREERLVGGNPCEFYQLLSPSCQKLALTA